MRKSNKKKWLLFTAIILLVVLSGCTRNTDANGVLLPERMISLTTTFSDVLSNDSWFGAFFVYPVAQAINFMTGYIGVVAAISISTVLVNLLTLPLTIKSSVGSQKMQMIQPEMNRITKKYEGKTDDRSRMAQANEMNALYKKYDIKPFGTLLGSFATLPIVLAMWNAVQRAEAVSVGTFIGLDLSVTPLAGVQQGQWMYAVIFILMGLAQFASMKLPLYLAKKKQKEDHKFKEYDPANKPKGKMQSQDSMIYFMFVFIMVISISWPTAMSIYWLVSALVTVAKSLYVQKVINNTQAGGK